MSAQNKQTKPTRNQIVSARKAEANRQNALKSTGPTTVRGKRFSRRNALKHGFFAKELFVDSIAQNFVQTEKPQEFQELLAEMREALHPVGRAEELEVEFIMVCMWRHRRLFRQENAEYRFCVAQVNIKGRVSNLRELMVPEDQNLICVLEEAQKEIEAKGALSSESIERIFLLKPSFRDLWSRFEAKAKGICRSAIRGAARESARRFLIPIAEATEILERRQGRNGELSSALAVKTVECAIKHIENRNQRLYDAALQISAERHAVPDGAALDKGLRYGSAIERDLTRAYDRLDRLQKWRRGEVVPLLNVNLR